MPRLLVISTMCILTGGLGMALVAGAARSGARQSPSDEQAGAFATGQYRNLFAEQGHTPAEIEARLNDSFLQLFHGDKDTQTLYYESGSNANGPLGHITDVANHDVRTEGMSYGMMIAVQMNRKREFDAIWNWANTYMLITDPANPSVGYFAWSLHADGTPRSDSPAPDGEEYFVMSLYFAANRWGSGKGIYNYKAQADHLLRVMRHHPVLAGTGPFRLQTGKPPFQPPGGRSSVMGVRNVGPMVNEQNRMIVFVPNSGGDTFSDPSYHLPAFYELWSRWGPPEDRVFWREAAARSRLYFHEVTNPATGLSPERANLDGSRMAGPDEQPMPFAYDSWRTASNWAVDYAWWRKDPEERVLSDRIQHFLAGEGVDRFGNQYTVDGKAISHEHSTGLLAATAAAGLAATPGPVSRAFVRALWDAPTPSGKQRYYDGVLYMMSLLHCGGQFRIWTPRESR